MLIDGGVAYIDRQTWAYTNCLGSNKLKAAKAKTTIEGDGRLWPHSEKHANTPQVLRANQVKHLAIGVAEREIGETFPPAEREPTR